MVFRVVSVVLVLVLVVSGCHRRYGPGVELEDQLEEIIRQSGISRDAQVLQMSIFVDHLVDDVLSGEVAEIELGTW